MQHHKPFDPGRPVVVSRPASTGPTSEAGKIASSKNALKHGCCADSTLILVSENISDYHALEAIWFNAYHPQSDAEKHLVQQLVNADWFLERANRTVAQVEAQIFESEYAPADWTDNQHTKLTRFTRYQTARANAVIKCRKAIEDFRKNRANETINLERHEIYKETHKPEPSIPELIEQMMQQRDARELCQIDLK